MKNFFKNLGNKLRIFFIHLKQNFRTFIYNFKTKLKLVNCFKVLQTLTLGALAGIAISLGCVAYLSSFYYGYIFGGAIAFTVGLFIILAFKFNLFTGKAGYILDNKPSYLLELLVIWVGNLLGAWLTAGVLRLTRLNGILDVCKYLAEIKLTDNIFSLFFLGALCNLLIYIAVHGYNNFEKPYEKILALFFGVAIFVICGFEHCVADMFYFAYSGHFEFLTLLKLIVITLGNVAGALIIPATTKLLSWFKTKEKRLQEKIEQKQAEDGLDNYLDDNFKEIEKRKSEEENAK